MMEGRLIVAARDAEWIWVHWQADPAVLAAAARGAGLKTLLRLYFDDTRSLAAEAICRIDSGQSYIKAPLPDRTYYVELGMPGQHGRFEPWLRSAPLHVPKPSGAAPEYRDPRPAS